MSPFPTEAGKPFDPPLSARERVEVALVALLGLTLPFAAFPVFSWRGFPVDSSHLAAAILIAVASWGTLLGRRAPPARGLLLACGAVMAAPLLALLRWSSPFFVPGRFARTWAHLVFLVLLLLAVASVRCSRPLLQRLFAVFVIVAVAVVLYGGYQLWAFYGGMPSGVDFLSRFSPRPIRPGGYWAHRATSILAEPSWLANYLLDAAVLAYVLWLSCSSARASRFGLFALVLFAAGIVSTFSLGGITAGAALLLLIGLHAATSLPRRRALPVLGSLLAVGLLAATLTAAGAGPVFRFLRNRIVSHAAAVMNARLQKPPGDVSGLSYLSSFRYSLEMWRSSPIWGVGLGQYAAAARDPRLARWYGSDFGDDPWTGMGWCAETGLVGAAAFAWLLCWLCVRRGSASSVSPAILPRLLVAAFLLKQSHSGSYIQMSAWYPLGIAALAATLSARGSDSREAPAEAGLRFEPAENRVGGDASFASGEGVE